MTPRPVDLIGVPSSAGAHGPGQEKAPSALRNAGLLRAASSAGLELHDLGDLHGVRFTPDPQNPKRQNVRRVREVADGVAAAVDRSVRNGHLPLVLGGDCTITLGVISGLLGTKPGTGLIYFDGDADLATPETTRSGIFDSMGLAHLLGIDGAEPELARMGARYPLLAEDHVALFGFQEYEAEPDELRLMERSSLLRYSAAAIRGRVADSARDALRRLAERSGPVVVHFDVDVMDSAEIPLANWPHYDALSLDDAMTALEIFLGAPELAAVVITEINPDHDPDGSLVSRLVDGLSRALRPLAAHPTAR